MVYCDLIRSGRGCFIDFLTLQYLGKNMAAYELVVITPLEGSLSVRMA